MDTLHVCLVGIMASLLVYGIVILQLWPTRRGTFAVTDEWMNSMLVAQDASYWDSLAAAELHR